MANLPTGTVTFLFTDIEGSTRLAQAHPAAWPAAQARHHAILQSAIESHGGYVFQIIGDAFCAAFHTAPDALAAALAAQRALQSTLTNQESKIPRALETAGEAPISLHPSAPFVPRQTGFILRVRMGVHTGAATLGPDGDYEGYLAMATAQRVMSSAYGGQTLVSNTSAALLAGQLPGSVSLRDMGEHRLKSLLNPEHLWQMVAPDLPQDFPPLQTLNAIPNNLPVQLTSFVGRERELSELKRLLATTRLLTLTGSGGTGKTRLSLQIAAALLADFPDGVWLVELAPLADPAFVPQSLASVLGIREQPGRPVMATLADHLRDKCLLLVLDNCEHLIEACAHVVDQLLHAAARMKILASSREALGIAGEATYRVPSLPSPNPKELLSATDLAHYDAVRLFVERAVSAKSSFAFGEANAATVAQICYRLDGIPLAIELAAARIRSFSPEQVAARLDDRFRLLTGGSRTALPRQQTLRALIDWSHSLLSAPERILLRRLSVFAGGWTLDAAESVCAGEELEQSEVLDLLSRIVEKSLAVSDDEQGEPRYRMLETIRQYAREKLLETGEAEQVRARHLKFFADLFCQFDEVATGLPGKWFGLAAAEQDNIRTAIEWALESRAVASGMRLTNAILDWYQQRHPAEGLERLAALLAEPDSSRHPKLRAQALDAAGYLEYWQGNYDLAWRRHEEALALANAEADLQLVSSVKRHLGQDAIARKDYPTARALLTDVLDFRRMAGIGYGGVLMELGEISQLAGELEPARALYEASVARDRVEGNKFYLPMSLRRLGQAAMDTGDYLRAAECIRESLVLNVELNDRRAVAACLAAQGSLAAALNRSVEAVCFHAAAQAFLESSHMLMAPFDRDHAERSLAALRAALSPATFAAAWEAGRQLTLDQAVALALSEPPAAPATPPAPSPAR